MKLFFAILIATSTVLSVKDGAVLSFYERSFTFPDTNEGKLLVHHFKYVNKGEAPLLIHDYKVSCSCTKVKFQSKPVMPGEEGHLEVYFDTNHKYGYQNRVIEIYSNASKKPEKIRIKVNVIPKGYK